VRGYRTLDWRFWVALAGCLMVAYLVIGGYQDNVRKGNRIDALIAAAQDANQQQAEADTRASQERQALLANQERLLRLYRHQGRALENLGQRMDGLLAYLSANGIPVPREFLGNGRRGSGTASQSSSSNSNTGGTSGGNGHPKGPGTTTPDLEAIITDLLDNLL
jgi:hypothetical protein